MTFDELLARYEAATSQERQRVLDMLPQLDGPLTPEKSALARELWEQALRAVFESEVSLSLTVDASSRATGNTDWSAGEIKYSRPEAGKASLWMKEGVLSAIGDLPEYTLIVTEDGARVAVNKPRRATRKTR